MRNAAAALCVVLALAVGQAAMAATVYVPVIDLRGDDGARIATQVFVSNYGLAPRAFALGLARDGDGLARAVASIRTVEPETPGVIADAAEHSERGLLAVSPESEMAVSALVESVGPKGQTFFVGVPVIRDTNRFAAGAKAWLSGFEHEARAIALANFGATEATCAVVFRDGDGLPTSRDFTVTVPAETLRQFDDALGVSSTRGTRVAEISCDRSFYALSVLQDADSGEIFIGAATGGTFHNIPPVQCSSATTPNIICYKADGTYHTATKDVPKGIIDVPVTTDIQASKVTIDFDVTVGPWDSKRPDWAHNIVWAHRSTRFRSNTMFNVNAFGPRRNLFKFNQNFDMAPGTVRVTQQGYTFQQGQTYHITATYDGGNRNITVALVQNEQTLRTLQIQGTAEHKTLTFLAGKDVVSDFGNYRGQAGPEVASVGWSWANYRVQLTKTP